MSSGWEGAAVLRRYIYDQVGPIQSWFPPDQFQCDTKKSKKIGLTPYERRRQARRIQQ